MMFYLSGFYWIKCGLHHNYSSNLSYSANVKTAIQTAKVAVSRFFVCAIVLDCVKYCKKIGRKMVVSRQQVVKRSYKIRVQFGHKSGGPPSWGSPPLLLFFLVLLALNHSHNVNIGLFGHFCQPVGQLIFKPSRHRQITQQHIFQDAGCLIHDVHDAEKFCHTQIVDPTPAPLSACWGFFTFLRGLFQPIDRCFSVLLQKGVDLTKGRRPKEPTVR
nr:MAG TPA: hypothetical protein [Caudoviricetes sp.]